MTNGTLDNFAGSLIREVQLPNGKLKYEIAKFIEKRGIIEWQTLDNQVNQQTISTLGEMFKNTGHMSL